MIKTKPIIGILATPYIKNNTSTEIFLKDNLVIFLKQNSIDYIIIPYSVEKVEI